MSFPLACPNCDAMFQVPDEIAGKRIKCKKCGEVIVARRTKAEQDDDPRPSPSPSKVRKSSPPASNRRSYDDDEDETPVRKPTKSSRQIDDDDDMDEPRPRPKKRGKKSRKKSGTPVLLFVLVGVGAVLLLGGGAVGVYYGLINEPEKSDSTPGANNAFLPGIGGPAPGNNSVNGWPEYQAPNFHFSVKMPSRNVVTGKRTAQSANGGAVDVDTYAAESADTGVIIIVVPLPGGEQLDENARNFALDTATNAMTAQLKGGQVLNKSSIRYLGFPGRDVVMRKTDGSEAMARMILAGSRIFSLLFVAKSGSVNQDRARQFFESLRIQ